MGVLKAVSLSNADKMVGLPAVQLGKHGGLLEEFKGTGHEWKVVAVLDRDGVQAPVFDAGAQ